MIDLHPDKCNLCQGKVAYTSNANIYGRRYGSGYCYLCTECGAYVGTHEPWPDRALGILADAEMRKWKMKCHKLFDPFWKGKRSARRTMYGRLAEQMGIPVSECHFGYFDLDELKKAYEIMETWRNRDDAG